MLAVLELVRGCGRGGVCTMLLDEGKREEGRRRGKAVWHFVGLVWFGLFGLVWFVWFGLSWFGWDVWDWSRNSWVSLGFYPVGSTIARRNAMVHPLRIGASVTGLRSKLRYLGGGWLVEESVAVVLVGLIIILLIPR